MMRLAWRELRHYRKESLTITVVVAAAMALFIIALSFVNSIAGNADKLLFGTVGATWLIAPETKDDAISVSEADLEAMTLATSADSVRARINLPVSLSAASVDTTRPDSSSVTFVGIDSANEPALLENFGIEPDAFSSGQQEIVVHNNVAEQLDLVPGDSVELTVGQSTDSYTVVGIANPTQPNFVLNGWVIGDRETFAETAFNDADRVTQILIDAPDTADTGDAVAAQASGLSGAASSHWGDTTWASLDLGPTIWAILIVAILSLLFLVIAIGLTSLMQSSLLSRMRDIAILKTNGMGAASVRRMHLLEIVILYCIGFLFAAIFATLIVTVVNAVGFTSTNDAFTFAMGSTLLSLQSTWWAYALPFVIGLVIILVVLWLPIRNITRQRVLDLLEMS